MTLGNSTAAAAVPVTNRTLLSLAHLAIGDTLVQPRYTIAGAAYLFWAIRHMGLASAAGTDIRTDDSNADSESPAAHETSKIGSTLADRRPVCPMHATSTSVSWVPRRWTRLACIGIGIRGKSTSKDAGKHKGPQRQPGKPSSKRQAPMKVDSRKICGWTVEEVRWGMGTTRCTAGVLSRMPPRRMSSNRATWNQNPRRKTSRSESTCILGLLNLWMCSVPALEAMC
ncbi:hypothetical protein BCR44DRAFT_1433467, partial [Catenaria anguillulae PL171]